MILSHVVIVPVRPLSSTEVLWLLVGIPNSRLDTDTWHFVIIKTSAEERAVRQKRKSSPNRKYCYKGGQGFEETRMYNATLRKHVWVLTGIYMYHISNIKTKIFKNKEIFVHSFQNFSVDLVTSVSRARGGGGNFHRLGYRMCHFLRVLFRWKINFWVYFIACNKFLGHDFSLE